MYRNYDVTKLSLDRIDFSSNKVINTINPHSYCVAKKDTKFFKSLLSSDILLADGVGIVWAEKLINGNKIKRITGYDLFEFFMKKLNKDKGSVFFLGSSENTLTKIKKKCSNEYPNIKVYSYSPPFKNQFTKSDSKLMCEKINQANPNVLFVGMTAPKQEKWVLEQKNNLNIKNICCIGAVFDFYAGNVSRAPKIMISLGLEWFHRSINSTRLFKRNFISNPKFVFDILKIKYISKNK